MKNKTLIITLVLVIILAILVVASLVLLKTPTIKELTPTQTPTFRYYEEGRDQLLNIIKSRPKLSESDRFIREKIIASIGNKSGYILESADYKIEYIKAPDIFHIEILSSNITSAKTEASEWFYNQGLSKEGLCVLPVMFYLSRQVTENLSGSVVEINLLPEGC